ncbi:hypothetical protein [Streptomyces sp. NPDC002537]
MDPARIRERLRTTAPLIDQDKDRLTSLDAAIGGASGPLFGNSFRALGRAFISPGPEADVRRPTASPTAAPALRALATALETK